MNQGISGGYVDRLLAPGAVGVTPSSAVSNQFLTGISTAGAVTRAQPEAANLSDYEIFDWVPTDQSGAAPALVFTVGYAKGYRLGKVVKLFYSITYPVTSDPNYATISLPYTVAAAIEGAFGGSVNNSTSASSQSISVPSGSNTARFRTSLFQFITNATISGISVRGQIDFLLP